MRTAIATLMLAIMVITTGLTVAPYQAHATWHHHKHKKR